MPSGESKDQRSTSPVARDSLYVYVSDPPQIVAEPLIEPRLRVCVMNTLEPPLTGVYVPVEVNPVIIFAELVVYDEVVLFLSFISEPY